MDKRDKVWTSIEAVKQDRVFYLDAKRFWPFDPIAVLAQAEEVADMIVSQKREREREITTGLGAYAWNVPVGITFLSFPELLL